MRTNAGGNMDYSKGTQGIGVIGALLIISLQGGMALVLWAIFRGLAQ